MKELPQKEKIRLELEEERERKLEIAAAKKSLWKLRSKEKSYERKPEKLIMLENIEKMEDRLTMIEKIIVDLNEEERVFRQKEEDKKKKELENWRKKVQEKDKKEKAKIEREEKVRLLSQRWAMHRWVTNFINENQEKWENERKLREEKAREELKSWEKMKRLEKISKLKEKWRKDRTPGEKLAKENEKPTREETWEVWRKKSETVGGGGGGGGPFLRPFLSH